jgi:hypothetical protein
MRQDKGRDNDWARASEEWRWGTGGGAGHKPRPSMAPPPGRALRAGRRPGALAMGGLGRHAVPAQREEHGGPAHLGGQLPCSLCQRLCPAGPAPRHQCLSRSPQVSGWTGAAQGRGARAKVLRLRAAPCPPPGDLGGVPWSFPLRGMWHRWPSVSLRVFEGHTIAVFISYSAKFFFMRE